MTWYSIVDWLELIWEGYRMSILLLVGAIIAVFMTISIIAGIARYYEELKR